MNKGSLNPTPGTLVIQRLENGKNDEFARRLHDWLKRELPAFLTRHGDREIFAEMIGETAVATRNDNGAVAAS